MIGFVEDISSQLSNNIGIEAFSNFNYIDTTPAFKEARDMINFIIPEFIKFISGDRRKSKVYGNIKKYYPEELVYINDNIIENDVNDLKNIDTIIEDSCSIYKNLRVVILKENMSLTNIKGFDILSLKKGEIFINTVFIEDVEVDTKLAFNICVNLFDKIITSTLYKYNIPVICSKYIPLLYTGDNGFEVSTFIVDYFYELLYPFAKNISTEKKEMEDIYYIISSTNFEIISQDLLAEIYKYINNSFKGYGDDFDYIGIIMDYQCMLEQHSKVYGIPVTTKE